MHLFKELSQEMLICFDLFHIIIRHNLCHNAFFFSFTGNIFYKIKHGCMLIVDLQSDCRSTTLLLLTHVSIHV